MQKYLVLVSVLMLVACGGGGAGLGQLNAVDSATVVGIPAQRVPARVPLNERITGMDSSVTNINEMTSAVEAEIGSDLLADISNNLDAMANSIRNYSNHQISDRRNNRAASVQNTVDNNDRLHGANAFLEYGRRFRTLDKQYQQQFVREHPEHHNFIVGWGKIFCGCDVTDYTNEQLLDVFDNSENQERFDNFYEQNHYKEVLLDDVRFNVAGFNDGEYYENEYIKFGIDNKTGTITNVAFVELDEDDNEIVTSEMTRNPGESGGWLDTFSDTEYKYVIDLGNNNYFSTDSFTTQVSDDELRDKIANLLEHKSDCGADCKNNILSKIGGEDGRWVEQVSDMSFALRGKNVGLKYSDFGYSTMVVKKYDGNDIPLEQQKKDHSVIMGGYKIKKIDSDAVTNNTMDFSGTAIGAAAYYLSGLSDSKQISTDAGAATLHVEDGAETVVMPFNDYYTVTVNRQNGVANVVFSNYPDGADENFKFNQESVSDNGDDLVHVQIDYYGDAGVPAEVVGGATYEEHSNGGMKSFESAFGVK